MKTPIDSPSAADDAADSFKELSRTFAGNVDDPYAIFCERRKTNPVMEGDILTEFGVPSRASTAANTRRVFTLFRYDDLSRVLREATTFRSGILAERAGALGQGMTSLDGEPHRLQRNMVQQALTPKAVRVWQAGLIGEAVRKDILGPLVERRSAELIRQVALKFPVRIMYRVIGFPDSVEEADYFAAQALWTITSVQTDRSKAAMALARGERAEKEVYDYTIAAIRERRRRAPGENCIIDCLIAANDNGVTLDDQQIAAVIAGLLSAAAETTTRSFSNLMVLLFDHPDQFERLRRDRALLPLAVSEAIRYEGPAMFLARQATTDVEIRGIPIPAGSALSLALASGNRDEAVFDDGDRFDITRKLKPSLSFGFGPHTCLGNHIAKIEIEAVLNGLLDLRNLRLDPEQHHPRIKGVHFRCADAIHVRWD